MRWLALLALAVLLAGCGAPATPAGTGIQGAVTLGPTCPVQRDPPDPRCADRPYAANLTFERGDGATVRASSAPDGTFRVDAAPGTYTVRTTEGDAPRHPACSTPQPIVVEAGRYTDAAVSCDTGIR